MAAQPYIRNYTSLTDATSEHRRCNLTLPVLPESLTRVEFGVSRTYIERVVALFRKNSAEVALRVPALLCRSRGAD